MCSTLFRGGAILASLLLLCWEQGESHMINCGSGVSMVETRSQTGHLVYEVRRFRDGFLALEGYPLRADFRGRRNWQIAAKLRDSRAMSVGDAGRVSRDIGNPGRPATNNLHAADAAHIFSVAAVVYRSKFRPNYAVGRNNSLGWAMCSTVDHSSSATGFPEVDTPVVQVV